MRNNLFLGLAGLVLIGSRFSGCTKKSNDSEKIDPSAPFVKIESSEGYKEAKVVGRSYYPGFNVRKNVEVSYGTPLFNDMAHSHDIPIELTDSPKYFLFIEIDKKTFVKEVNITLFREAYDGSSVMVRYNVKREVKYKPGVELETISNEFNDLEILSLEIKKE